MATTAFQTMYRSEWYEMYERNKSTLRQTTTQEIRFNGREAVFLGAISGGEAVTRGADGLIPVTPMDMTQTTVTVSEAFAKKTMNNFNIEAGQSQQREIMQKMTLAPLMRHVDDIIVDQLETATVIANATASIMTKQLVNVAVTKLGNANAMAMDDGMVFGLVTPAAWAHLSDLPEFARDDWVGDRPLVAGPMQMGEPPRRWMKIWWICHTGLPSIGLSTAKCFIYNKSAIGYASLMSDIVAEAGFLPWEDQSWALSKIYDGSKKLQNSGIVVVNHDDSVYS